jgi:hypothetical protein
VGQETDGNEHNYTTSLHEHRAMKAVICDGVIGKISYVGWGGGPHSIVMND